MGYKFVSSYWNSFFVDKGVQTDAWEDYSDRPSQIVSDSITSIDTVTPRFSPIEQINVGTSTLAGDSSTVTTILPIPPVNIEVIPNPDILVGYHYKYLDSLSPLQLKKFNEIKGLYSQELWDNVIYDHTLADIISGYTVNQLSSSNFNELIYIIITCFNG